MERDVPLTIPPAAAPELSWRPRTWVAMLLSILLPGLGHLYAGRPLRGIALVAALHVLTIAAILLVLVAPGAVIRVALLVVFLLALAAAAPVDAARVARRAAPGPPRVFQRWYLLAAVWLVATIIVPDWFSGFVKRNVAEAFKIPSGSMSPTLLIGDFILASHMVPETIERGTVVIYRAGEPNTHYTHRVVGIPGDTLEMRDFRLYRNGAPAAEPYAHSDDAEPDPIDSTSFAWQHARTLPGGPRPPSSPSYGSWGRLVVPRDSVFILGDDRNNSLDSRHRGFIPRAAVVAVPAWIYFSRDPETGEIRWDRIGRRVE